MKKNLTAFTASLSLCATLAIPSASSAQEEKKEHHQYKLIDVGTFGGPSSLFSNPDSRVINSRGTATGVADTSIPTIQIVFYDCLVDHTLSCGRTV